MVVTMTMSKISGTTTLIILIQTVTTSQAEEIGPIIRIVMTLTTLNPMVMALTLIPRTRMLQSTINQRSNSPLTLTVAISGNGGRCMLRFVIRSSKRDQAVKLRQMLQRNLELNLNLRSTNLRKQVHVVTVSTARPLSASKELTPKTVLKRSTKKLYRKLTAAA